MRLLPRYTLLQNAHIPIVCCAFTSIESLAKSLLKVILHILMYEALLRYTLL